MTPLDTPTLTPVEFTEPVPMTEPSSSEFGFFRLFNTATSIPIGASVGCRYRKDTVRVLVNAAVRPGDGPDTQFTIPTYDGADDSHEVGLYDDAGRFLCRTGYDGADCVARVAGSTLTLRWTTRDRNGWWCTPGWTP